MRRNNAPIRPPRPRSIFADLLIASSAAFGAMGLIFLVVSFNGDLVVGDAGVTLARLFAATLLFAGLFVFLLGWLLLYSERNNARAYAFPFMLGTIIGVLSSALLLAEAGRWVSSPFALLVLTLPGLNRLYRR